MRLAWPATVAGALGALFVPRRVMVIRVLGTSMFPTFRTGQRVLAMRLRGRKPQKGEVIVFETPMHRLPGSPALRVKRVVACEGDLIPAWLAAREDQGSVVPPGWFVVAGDNRTSEDSRHLGLIPLAAIKGVVGGTRKRQRCG